MSTAVCWNAATVNSSRPSDAADVPRTRSPPGPANFLDLAGAASSACRHGEQPQPDCPPVNAGGSSGLDRVQVVAALMAIDAGLERLRHAVLEKGLTMIVKFHPRGRGGGAGPVDYLLGKDRQRDGASVLQGSRRKSGSLSTPRPTPKGHCCKVSDEAAFCLIQRPYISKTLLTRRISPRGSP